MALVTTDAAIDDAALVRAVQGGDTGAYAELFQRHYPAVRRACLHRLRNTTEAEEVAQSAFVRALERIDRCGGERRFGGWVQVIAERLCIDAIRASGRVFPTDAPVSDEHSDHANPPEDAVMRRQLTIDLRDALDQLPTRQREVIVARDLDERRPPEIAAALGLSIGAVDSLLMRARRRLAGAYRSTAGESGISTAASSAAMAGTTLAAGSETFRSLVVGTARAVENAVVAAPGIVAAAPGASVAVRRTVAAVAAAVSLGIGAVTGSPVPVPRPPEPTAPAIATPVPVPGVPGTPGTPAPPTPIERPALPTPVPATPDAGTPDTPSAPVAPAPPSAPTLAPPAPPAVPAPPEPQEHEPVALAPAPPPDQSGDPVGSVTGAVTGALDTLPTAPPVG